MPYAIELYLDKEASIAIKEIHAMLKENGISIDEGTKPHVSLCIYEGLPLIQFEYELRQFADETAPFDVIFTNIDAFKTKRPVVFLAPEPSQKLADVQRQFHKYFSKYRDAVWQYYQPESWIPHCTLCMDLSHDMYLRANEILKDVQLPIKGTFERIGILKFRPNEQLSIFDLGAV